MPHLRYILCGTVCTCCLPVPKECVTIYLCPVRHFIGYLSRLALPSDDDFPASLSFSASDPDDEFCEIDYETVDSVSEDDPCTIGDKTCYAFTATELSTIHHALTNALEYFKECLANKDGLYDGNTLDEIKTSSVSCRNLQAKVGKVLNSFK